MNTKAKKAKELIYNLGREKAKFYAQEQIDNSYSDSQAMFWNEVLQIIST